MIFRSKFLLIVMMSLEMAFLIMSIFKYLELEIKRTGDVGRPFIVRESEEEALSCAVLTQLCPTLCDPMDYRVHGILQARILEWVAFPFSRGSSQLRDRILISCISGGFFNN